jgi:thiol-disulfide isomerase/thioredoxin
MVAALVAGFACSLVSAEMVGQMLPSGTLNFLGPKPEMEGKPLLLEFWATWCPPCRESIPHLNEIHAKYKDRGLLVVGVTDEPNAVIRKFQKEVPMDYAVATDNGGRLNEKMGVSGIPQAFLVNKSGEIVWEGHPMKLRDEDIGQILE